MVAFSTFMAEPTGGSTREPGRFEYRLATRGLRRGNDRSVLPQPAAPDARAVLCGRWNNLVCPGLQRWMAALPHVAPGRILQQHASSRRWAGASGAAHVGAAGHGARGLVRPSSPVPILLSARSRNLASMPTRMLLAALYVALPNAREIHLVATNTQWHLALTAALVAFACSPQTWRGRLFDVVVLAVAALTGPYCIVLAPVVLLFWWVRRQPWSLVVFALVSAVACVQIAVLTHSTLTGFRVRWGRRRTVFCACWAVMSSPAHWWAAIPLPAWRP